MLFNHIQIARSLDAAKRNPGRLRAASRIAFYSIRACFKEIKAGTRLGKLHGEQTIHLNAWNNDGINIGEELFDYSNNEIRTKKPLMPAMLTLNEKVIRQDCLCYLMERYPL